jgi:hypothetical protein
MQINLPELLPSEVLVAILLPGISDITQIDLVPEKYRRYGDVLARSAKNQR